MSSCGKSALSYRMKLYKTTELFGTNTSFNFPGSLTRASITRCTLNPARPSQDPKFKGMNHKDVHKDSKYAKDFVTDDNSKAAPTKGDKSKPSESKSDINKLQSEKEFAKNYTKDDNPTPPKKAKPEAKKPQEKNPAEVFTR